MGDAPQAATVVISNSAQSAPDTGVVHRARLALSYPTSTSFRNFKIVGVPQAATLCISTSAQSAPDTGVVQRAGVYDYRTEYEFILVEVTPPIWWRLVRGLLTIAKVRSFWGRLGHYLKEVKHRGL